MSKETAEFLLEEGCLLEFNYVLMFYGEPLFKTFVTNNIQKRNEETDKNKKDLYKLFNNAVYGKTCQNVFKYRSFNFESVEEAEENPNMSARFTYVNEETVLWENEKKQVTLEMCPQVGFHILEMAKMKVYKFLKAVVELNCVVPLYTDTDSLYLQVLGKEPYDALVYLKQKIPHLLDYEISPDDWVTDPKKIPGLWALETVTKEDHISKFIALKAKQYAMKMVSDKDIFKAKGIKKDNIVVGKDKKLGFDDFYDSFINMENILTKDTRFVVDKKKIIRVKTSTRIGLSNADLKRYTTANRTTTLPWGYGGLEYLGEVENIQYIVNHFKTLLE